MDSLVVAGGFTRAVACTIDPFGNSYVIDAGENEVLKISPAGGVTARMGGYGWSEDAMDQPRDIVTPNGLDVYIADYGNHRVLRLDRNLSIVSTLPGADLAADARDHPFGYPRSVALSRFGDLMITDGENARIIKVNTNNEVERSFGGIGAGEGRLATPARVRVSTGGRVYVQDVNRIVVFDLFGNYLQSIGGGLFRGLKTFTMEGDTLYAVDSCSVFRCEGGGSHMERGALPAGLCPSTVDVVVQGGAMYILTAHELLKVSMEDINLDRAPE